ncbi:MAG TPA: hypothetical protein VFP15_13480 [Gemmatimonadaceae bacterium]|nr:hypothetical protein [Gemmatimonadaceae bacterium]
MSHSDATIRADSYGDHLPTEHPELPGIIAREVEALNKTITAIIALAPVAEVAMSAVQEFTPAFEHIECYASHVGDSVWINVRTKTMTPVVALRRWLASRGYHINSPLQSYPNDFRQVFCLGRITLNVRFPGGEGATCRFVQTGTKTVPTYELRCDGGAEGGAQ